MGPRQLLGWAAVALTAAYLFMPDWEMWLQRDNPEPLRELLRSTHIHGLGVNAESSELLYLSTHDGLFLLGQDGKVRRVPGANQDFASFAFDPRDPKVIFASGHQAAGGNLGLLTSADGGNSWRKLGVGTDPPADFHELVVAKAIRGTIYGVSGGLQISRDGGRTWNMAGALPDGLLGLAASAFRTATLFAGTDRGIFISTDGGSSWQIVYRTKSPVTAIAVSSTGRIYAYVLDTGLISAEESTLSWTVISGEFSESYISDLALDPADGMRMFAVKVDLAAKRNAVLETTDDGRTWFSLGAS